MPDALIPSLGPDGLNLDLHIVPGYTVLPDGSEDMAWRERYYAWQREVRSWRLDSQALCLENEGYRKRIDELSAKDTALFVTHWLEVEEPRAMESGGEVPEFDPFNMGALADAGEISDYRTIHPFIPYAYQVQGMQIADHIVFGAWRSKRLNVLWDKARGVGFTYGMLAWAYKNWLMRKGFRATVLTEKWDKADRSHSLNTLFGKLDLFFDSTPDWLIPPGFRSKGEKDASRQKGMLYNPHTGATLSSEPTTASSTRSGREAAILIDECAFQEYLDELWATAIGTTLHILGWSTASWQMGMQWQNKVDEARKDKSGTTKLIEIEYYEAPHQDAEWKAETEAVFVAAGLAEQFRVEYLRDASSGYGTLVYKEQVDRCPDTHEWYDPSRPLYRSVDPGIQDPTAWVFWQNFIRDGKKWVRIIDSYERDKMPVEFHAHLMTGIPPRPPDDATGFEGDLAWPLWEAGLFGETELYFMEWLRDIHPDLIEDYGDPAILTKDHSHESFAVKINDISEEIRIAAGIGPYGIFPMGASWKPIYKRNNFNERRIGARKALMHLEFSLTDGAQLVRQALERTRLQEMTEKTVRPPGHIHDRYSHRVQAFEFGMIWETLELTAEEVAPAKPANIRSIHKGRRALSPYQRQHKSLMGVA